MSTEKNFTPDPAAGQPSHRANDRVVKSAAAPSFVAATDPGFVSKIAVYNTNAAQRFIHVFDADTLPANGATPDFPPVPVAANAWGEVDFPSPGLPFDDGLVVALSSTDDTLTIATANDGTFIVFLRSSR